MSKILRCGDQHFWAYRFLSDEHIKYSRHDMKYVKHDEVNYNQDLLYIHSPDISPAHALTIPKLARGKGVKVIGAYAGSPVFWKSLVPRIYSHSDLIVTISPQTYEFAKLNYPKEQPIVFLPESIDTKFFKPKNWNRMGEKKELVVGWAGGAHKKIKRTYLLDQLDFPVTIKSDWKEQRINNVTNLEGMKPFYKSIDVLVITSLSECMPRVALEAMACGIPVISTDVGGMRMLIDKEFIVPVNPESSCVDEINARLQLLYKYPVLRQAVAKRNRAWIEKYWSWTNNAPLWDDVFSSIIEGKVNKAVKMADKFLNNFDYCWDLLRTRFRNIYEVPEVKKPNKKREKYKPNIIHNSFKNIFTPHQKALMDVLNLNIPCWLLKRSCLDCVLYHGKKLTTKLINFGIDNLIDAIDITNDLEELGYKKITDYCVEKDELVIELIIDPKRKTKVMALLDIQVLVPIPVLRYLKETFGEDWENLK